MLHKIFRTNIDIYTKYKLESLPPAEQMAPGHKVQMYGAIFCFTSFFTFKSIRKLMDVLKENSGIFGG